MAKKQYVNFLEFHAPLLKSGKYDITLEQSMQIDNETVLSPAPLTKVVYVQGNRFALDSDQIHTVYPQENSQGDFSSVLPHIVLNRSILPWERSVDGAVNSVLPWMALLVFDSNEENNVPITKTISVEQFYESSKGSEVVVPYFKADPPTSIEDLLEPGEAKDDPVNVLDVPKSLLTPILPKYSDLKFIAHVRRTVEFKGQYVAFDTFLEKFTDIEREEALTIWTVLQEKGVVVDDQKTAGAHIFPKIFFPTDLEAALATAGSTTDINTIKSAILSLKTDFFTDTQSDFDSKGEEKAFIVANRMAKMNSQHEVHLVALFNCYDKTSKAFNFSDASDDKPIRLISYKNWSFSSEEAKLDFLGLAKDLNVGNLGKDDQATEGNASTNYLQSGFTALPHHLRTGKNTVSFYRGPLIPGTMAPSASTDNLPVETSDRLLRYDKKSGMLDLSYAAAWELGRKMGLSDQHFSKNLYLLKKQYTQKEKRRNQYPAISHLPVSQEKEQGPPPLFCLHGHTQDVTAVCFSKDGNTIFSASEDKTAKLWRADTGELIFSFEGHTDTINATAYAPDGGWVLTGSSDFKLIMWDTQSGKRMRSIQHAVAVTTIDISADGTTMAVGLADHSILIYDTSSFLEVGQLRSKSGSFTEGHEGLITSVKFSKNGSQIITASEDQTAKVWDINSFQVLLTLRGGADEVVAIDDYESEGRNIIAVASRNGTIKIFNSISGAEEHSFNSTEGGIKAAVFSIDGLSLLTATFNHKIEEWNLETGETLEPFSEGHSGAILALQLSPSGNEILTGSADSNVILWRKSTRSPIRTFFGHHTDIVTAIETSDDLSLLLTASADKTVKVWNTETFELIKILEEHTEIVNAVSLSPNGEVIVTAGNDNKAIIWDAKTFDKRYELTGHSGKINCAGFSSDSSIIFTGSDDGNAILWDTDSGISFQTLSHGGSPIKCATFSHDNSLIATAGEASKIRVWETLTGINKLSFDSQQTIVSALDISLDKLQLLSAGSDHTAKIWNISDGTEMANLSGQHTSPLLAAIFTKDHQRALTADTNGQIIVWDTAKASMIHQTEPLPGVTIKGFADEGRIVKYVNETNAAILNKTFSENGRFIKQRKGINTTGLQKANEGPEEVLVEWLDKFNDLADIPFHYLVPNTDFLQEESLRFFQMDPYWIKCLKDGALSLGDTRKPNGQENDLRSFWSDPVGQTNGFLLHSSLVSGFPDMEIRGYDTAHKDTDLHSGGIKPRLTTKLSDKVLLCLFDEGLTIQTLDLFLPPGAIHFGFKEVKSELNGQESITYIKDHKDLFGHESGGQFQLQDSLHWDNNRVIDFEKMLIGDSSETQQSLQRSLLGDNKISVEGKDEFQGFTSADFALEMLEGSPLIRINLA